MYNSTLSLTSALDRGWVVNATPGSLYPQERPGTHCIGGWLGPRAGLDGCGKSRPPPGFDPRTVQPIASRYTNCAVPAHRHKGQYQNIFNGYRPNSLWDGNRSSMDHIPVAGVCVSFTDPSGSKSKEWRSVSLLAFTISF